MMHIGVRRNAQQDCGLLVGEGQFYWEKMQKDYNLNPRLARYKYMVNLFCYVGLLWDAYYAFISNMVYSSLLHLISTVMSIMKLSS